VARIGRVADRIVVAEDDIALGAVAARDEERLERGPVRQEDGRDRAVSRVQGDGREGRAGRVVPARVLGKGGGGEHERGCESGQHAGRDGGSGFEESWSEQQEPSFLITAPYILVRVRRFASTLKGQPLHGLVSSVLPFRDDDVGRPASDDGASEAQLRRRPLTGGGGWR
jgi:hypothetical protein